MKIKFLFICFFLLAFLISSNGQDTLTAQQALEVLLNNRPQASSDDTEERDIKIVDEESDGSENEKKSSGKATKKKRPKKSKSSSSSSKSKKKKKSKSSKSENTGVSNYFFNNFVKVVEDQVFLVKSNYGYTDDDGEIQKDHVMNIGVALSNGTLITPNSNGIPWREQDLEKENNVDFISLSYKQIGQTTYSSQPSPEFKNMSGMSAVQVGALKATGAKIETSKVSTEGYVLVCTKNGGSSTNPNVSKELRAVKTEWSDRKAFVDLDGIDADDLLGGVFYSMVPNNGALELRVSGLLEKAGNKDQFLIRLIPSGYKPPQGKRKNKRKRKNRN